MTRAEREQQIARYLRGDMTPAEEESFFIQVALDGELRTELKAHRIIDDSIENYRRSQARPHTTLRERTTAMLASHHTFTRSPSALSLAQVTASSGDAPESEPSCSMPVLM